MNRYTSLLLAIGLLVSASAFAQDPKIEALIKGPNLVINETSAKLSKKAQPAFTMYLNADDGDVEKQWKTYVNTRYSVDLHKSKKHLEALNIRMADIAEGSVSLYSKVDKDEAGARFDVFLQVGSEFIDTKSHPTESGKLKNVMDDFAREVYVGVYEEALDDERKEHSKISKDFDKLAKDLEKLDKDINGSEEDIEDAEKEISEAEGKIKELQLKISEERLKIEEAKKELAGHKKEHSKVSADHRAKKSDVDERSKRIERLKSHADGIRKK